MECTLHRCASMARLKHSCHRLGHRSTTCVTKDENSRHTSLPPTKGQTAKNVALHWTRTSRGLVTTVENSLSIWIMIEGILESDKLDRKPIKCKQGGAFGYSR